MQPSTDNAIVCKSLLGFELNLGGHDCRMKDGLMMRHGSEFYGRPVYQSEDGSQFLYWMKDADEACPLPGGRSWTLCSPEDPLANQAHEVMEVGISPTTAAEEDGTLEEGIEPEKPDAGDAKDTSAAVQDSVVGYSTDKLLKFQGKWVIASEIGKAATPGDCLACTSACNFITPYEINKVDWWVSKDGKFESCKSMKLTEQEGLAGDDRVSKHETVPKKEAEKLREAAKDQLSDGRP